MDETQTTATQLGALRVQAAQEIEDHLKALRELCFVTGNPIDRNRLDGILGRKKKTAPKVAKPAAKKPRAVKKDLKQRVAERLAASDTGTK